MNLQKRLSGIHIFLARGTGMIPFLDFASLILRYIFYKIPTDNYNFDKNRVDEESFDYIDNDFKFILFNSVYNEKSLLMHRLLTEADRLDKKYKFGIFDYHYIIEKNITKQKLNSDFMKISLINDIKHNNIRAVYLCGTNEFMESAREELSKINLIDENVIVEI